MMTWDNDLDFVLNALDRKVRLEMHKCGCRNVTTIARGVLIYTCAPCTEEARRWLAGYQNPHTDQIGLFADPRD